MTKRKGETYAEYNKRQRKNYLKAYYTSGKGRKTRRNLHRRYRDKCLFHYSGGTLRCACCGEDNIDFLTLDHVNNDGFHHRKKDRHKGKNTYFDLIKKGFPNDPPLQVLCFNCNCGKHRGKGTCPHHLKTTADLFSHTGFPPLTFIA